MKLDWGFKDKLPILGVLHMEKVARNGVDCISNDGEENRDHVPMIGCAPIECVSKVLTADEKVAATMDEWEALIVDEVETTLELEEVPSIVETMARRDDTVGVASTKIFRLLVLRGGVNPTVNEVIVPMVSRLRL